jgi:antitoxin HicB
MRAQNRQHDSLGILHSSETTSTRVAENRECDILSKYMDQRQFTYSLAIEEQDGGYLAHFPALPGCLTWGVTYHEAVNNAREALVVYLETLAENGDPIPEETTQEPVSLGVTVRTPIIV